MKINLLLLYILLIVLQSTMAVADLHQSHQTGQEHLSFNHLDTDDIHQTDYTDNSQADTITSYDCHHCCHCHGVACHYLENNVNNVVAYYHSRYLIESTNLFYTRIITPDLRPPIV